MIQVFFYIFTLLILWHFVADYVLQTEFIAKFKSHKNSLDAAPWYYVLFAHCATHALGVFLITGNIVLVYFQLITHFIIDWLKCDERTNIHVDQLLHFIVMALTAAWYTVLFFSK
jgi:hypothetical protein